ncbi:MAG: TonB-dependent receptor [Acidobacteria bacterium]|nr:TonB-dependent receptor [Acidobacteriota bacterium]
MKFRVWFAVLGLLSVNVLLCNAAEIRGKVTDPQGAAVADVSITLEREGSPAGVSALTGKDGTFSLGDLPAAAYTLLARKAGFAELKQGPIRIVESAEPQRVNLRLLPSRETEVVRGTEERNPNDFVIRLDTNSIKNEQLRTGTPLRFIPEFRATSNYYGEQFGYPLRSVPTTSLGRPTSSLRGSVYEFHQNNHLNARPFFQVGPILPSRRNQYGFSLGGPVRKERLWFTFAWDQVRDSGFVNGNVQVPLASERTPRASDPRMNTIIAALLNAYPTALPNLPQVSVRHLNTNAFRDIKATAFSWHLDYRAPWGDSLAVDHQFQDYTEEPFELVVGQNPRTLMRPQGAGLTYTHPFSARTVAQIGLNYRRLAVQLLPTKRFLELAPAALLPNGTPDVEFGEDLTQLGLVNQGMPRARFENHYYLTPQITHTSGRHNLSAGATVQHLWDSDLRNYNVRGTITFNADCISVDGAVCQRRSSVENFLAGIATRMSVTEPNQYSGYRSWEYAFYIQDRFRFRPNLSLLGGLRYEILTVPQEVSHIFKFSYKTDANNVAPQVGFAWNPGSGKTVVRGGYGIAFSSITLGTFSREANSSDYVKAVGINTPTLQDWLNITSVNPTPGRRGSLNKVDAGIVAPYVHTYNLYLERELPGQAMLRLGYLGSRAFKLLSGTPVNRARPVAGIPTISATVNQRRPDLRYGRVFILTNGSTGYLDALQFSLLKRRGWGLNFEATYTFSKAINSGMTNFAETGNGDDASQSDELVSDTKGVASFDTPHAFTLNYSYDLPRPGNAGIWLSRLLGGWTVSGTTVLRSGTPFSVFTGSDAPGWGNVDGEDKDRPNIKNPGLLGKSIDNPDTSAALMGADVPCVDRGGYIDCKYFDTNVSPGGRGNIGYRTFRKDGTNNWNLAVSRSFTLGSSERQLQFRSEFFNFFNHAQFAAPGFLLTSPTFGKITNTVNKGRVTQLTLRYLF